MHADFSFVPPLIFLEILEHEDLAVQTELDLLLRIEAYLQTRKRHNFDEVLLELAERMVRCVRFVHFSMDEMNHYAIKNALIPRDLIIEVLAEKVKQLEGGGGGGEGGVGGVSSSSCSSPTLASSTNPTIPPPIPSSPSSPPLSSSSCSPSCASSVSSSSRFRARKQCGLIFDFDEKKNNGVGPMGSGVINWIATKYGSQEYQNPTTLGGGGGGGGSSGEGEGGVGVGGVRVSVSSVERGDPGVLLGGEVSELWTADVPASWICIDLGERRGVVPTYYTVRHGGNYKGDSLRHWDLQVNDLLHILFIYLYLLKIFFSQKIIHLTTSLPPSSPRDLWMEKIGSR